MLHWDGEGDAALTIAHILYDDIAWKNVFRIGTVGQRTMPITNQHPAHTTATPLWVSQMHQRPFRISTIYLTDPACLQPVCNSWPLCLRSPQDQKYLSMRAEVESPFRTFRIALLTFFLVSASIASLVATSQLIGSLGNAPAAMPLSNTIQTFGIDIGAVSLPVHRSSKTPSPL